MRGLACILLVGTAALAQKTPAPPAKEPAAASPGRGAAPAAAGAPGPRELKYPAARAIQAPPITTFTLSNGMKVYLNEDHELPMVSGNLLIRTGSLFDPPERIGVAQMTGTLLRSGGTALKTAEQFDDLLDNAGAVVEASIGESQGTISFSTMKENTDTVLALLKEMVTQPGFRSDRMEQVRAQMRGAIGRRNDNAEALASREMRGLVFGKDTPFGWDQQFTTIDRINRGDVRKFYQRYFFPANVMLGIQGDFDSAQLKASLERVFGDWTAQQPPVPAFPKVKNAPTPGIFVAEKRDLTETYFTIGHLGGAVNDKDTAAMEVSANILGGPRGRLAERTRVRMGNAAEFHVVWGTAPDHPGLFQISGKTRNISTVETVKAVQEELERVRTSEVTDDELRVARDMAVTKAIFEIDSKAKIFSALLNNEYYGYPKDFLQERQKALQAVTRADVLRASKQYLVPGNLAIVVAGNPMLFGDPLERLGAVTKLDLTMPQSKPELADTTDTSLAQGKQILQRAQKAIGGADRMAAVRDYSMSAQYQIDASVSSLGGLKIMQTDRWVSPTSFRQDSVLPSGEVAAYTDGKIGWISTPQGWGPLAGIQSKQVLGDLFRLYFRLMLSDRLEGRTVNAIDDTTIQVSDATGQVASVEFDPKSGLPRKVSYDTPQAAGPALYSEDVYDDFRDIGGVQVPFKMTINQGGQKFADVTVTEYKMNAGIKASDLAKRPQ